jgi:O-antigen ligase
MTMAALLIAGMKTRVLSKLQMVLATVVVAAVVASGVLSDMVELPEIGAVYALLGAERDVAGGSNYGKLVILENSPAMVARSPVFGWGQRRFADIAGQGFAEELPDFSHFYFLTVLLSSGVVGFLAQLAVSIAIARALWRRRQRDYAVMCAVFVAVGLYGFLYDAGHLDVFASFNGVAAYWALRSVEPGAL